MTNQDEAMKATRQQLKAATGQSHAVTDFLQSLSAQIIADAVFWANSEQSLAERVHELRKCIKRQRALLELAAEAVRKEQRKILRRELSLAAHGLAPGREQAALAELLQLKLQRQKPLPDPQQQQEIFRQLGLRLEDNTAGSIEAVHAALTSIQRSRIDASAFSAQPVETETVVLGFEHNYRLARRLLRKAKSKPNAKRLHHFRTLAKRHLYHLTFLNFSLIPAQAARHKTLHGLCEKLGEHHDLFIITQRLSSQKDPDRLLTALRRALRHRMRRLERRAFELGPRCFASKPRAIAQELRLFLAKQW